MEMMYYSVVLVLVITMSVDSDAWFERPRCSCLRTKSIMSWPCLLLIHLVLQHPKGVLSFLMNDYLAWHLVGFCFGLVLMAVEG